MKTCSKHRNPAPKLKKHPRTELEQWDSFLYEIKAWNQDQKQERLLDVRYIFDLDKLPVNFGVSVEINDDDNSEFRQQDQTIGVLVDNIHEAGEHRFRKLRTKKANEHEYDYCCCQDSARVRKRETLGKRDRLQMKRYRCNSKLSIKPDLINRRLTVVLRHKYHSPYVNIRLSTAALAFVAEKCLGHTPAEIYRGLKASKLPGVDRVAEHQVYYQWQCANSSLWKCDADPVISASEFLDENRSKYQHATYLSGNLRGLALYIRGTMDALVSRAKELVIDATYGTNSSGMSLSAVLAELDGTGVPLCYLFVGTASISDQKLSSADAKGATTCILKQFLQPLKDAGYSPKFFGCDKDNSEISAIRNVWLDATAQLCYWHAKRAIKKKLSDARKTVTQANYNPEKARSFVPTLEICWGSRPTRRPDGTIDMVAVSANPRKNRLLSWAGSKLLTKLNEIPFY
ncbi:hypothetical protein K3495_g9257 [Podosphaera aphanis]|nr:hypothetical protein K3495_g9257 [Podosphaera aphanis]